MKKLILLYLLLCLSFSWSNGQSTEFKEDFKFLSYLLNLRNYNDALQLLDNMKVSYSGANRLDTISFYTGKAYYLNQNLLAASQHFSAINNTTLPFYEEAVFFNAFSQLHLNNYDQAGQLLNSLAPDDSLIMGLQNVELAGTYLLQRNFDAFEQKSKNFKQQYYQYSQQEESLNELYADLKNHKRKSPFLGGLYSAIIPGAGKIYAGKTGQGIGTLLTTTIFGLQALEGYRKDGPESARFIIFGSIFSVFYIGNIWGSVFTVKLSQQEFNEAVNHQILFDLHIPLRTIYQ